jgi:hypothetical protein
MMKRLWKRLLAVAICIGTILVILFTSAVAFLIPTVSILLVGSIFTKPNSDAWKIIVVIAFAMGMIVMGIVNIILAGGFKRYDNK